MDVQRCGRTAASCAVGCINEESCSLSIGWQCTAFSFIRGSQCPVGVYVYLNASNFIRWESMVISASSIYAIPSSSTNISIFGQFSDDGGAISIRIIGMCHRSVPTTLFDHCTVTKTFFRNFLNRNLKDQRFPFKRCV